MFRVTKEPVAWIDQKWRGLDDDGYEVEKSMRLRVRFLPASEVTGLYTDDNAKTADLAKKVIVDWDEILGETGKAFAFTPENLDLVLEHEPGFMRAFGVNYLDAWGGQGRVREKNSESSPGDGRADGADESRPPASKTS